MLNIFFYHLGCVALAKGLLINIFMVSEVDVGLRIDPFLMIFGGNAFNVGSG